MVRPIALLVASSKIKIPRLPIINSMGNLKLSPIRYLKEPLLYQLIDHKKSIYKTEKAPQN